MAELSKKLMNMISEFVVCELGAKVMQGITYSMFLSDNPKDSNIYKRYTLMKDEALRCGFNGNEVVRMYTVGNGFIVDVDLVYVKEVLLEVSKAVAIANGDDTYTDRIGDKPEKRKEADFRHMAKFLKKNFEMGNNQLEIVLFNKAPTNRLAVNGVGPHDEELLVRYNAYALRPDDIEMMNELFLIPAGFRVASIRACEILPRKKGCVFEFRMETVN